MLDSIVQSWYNQKAQNYWLWPLSAVYRILQYCHRLLYNLKILASFVIPVPVIVVGNITVGGSGKTPLVCGLVKELQALGFRVGVVSRGYGGNYSLGAEVHAHSVPSHVGDEPVLIAKETGAKVMVAKSRVYACRALLARYELDVIISDDGLQHFALRSAIKICVVDAVRGFGNTKLLPQGPLREPLSRLAKFDYILLKHEANRLYCSNEILKQLIARNTRARVYNFCRLTKNLVNIKTGALKSLQDFAGTMVHAVLAIANPESLLATLRQYGINYQSHLFADHHSFKASDLIFAQDLPIICSSKDAVKLQDFENNIWVLQTELELDNSFAQDLLARLMACKQNLAPIQREVRNVG